MFICGAPVETVLSDVGVSRSTFGLIFWRFVEAMLKQASRHLCWPDSMKMESTKSKFKLIYGMPNCCGVVDTACITTTPSAEPNCDHENNHSITVQVGVDPDTKITDIFIGWSGSILQSSDLFKACENGQVLNGSKLKLSDESEVGEYIIGDAGYPLLPWLLTPYQEKDLSGPKLEFNRRHSAARTIAQKVLARLKDTWKWMYQGGSWGLLSRELLHLSAKITHVSCMLHNIVIDMEGAALEERIPSNLEMNYREQACQLADENTVRVRDMLSQHLANISSKFGGKLRN
uniref:Uncharacterized protein n=1 Tax=Avena sativa TaxID=4498 RepID=A0ACD5WND3_AVESA